MTSQPAHNVYFSSTQVEPLIPHLMELIHDEHAILRHLAARCISQIALHRPDVIMVQVAEKVRVSLCGMTSLLRHTLSIFRRIVNLFYFPCDDYYTVKVQKIIP